MMQPKRTKYRKAHKGRNDGLTKAGAELNFGAFGMKATGNARSPRARSRPRGARSRAISSAPGGSGSGSSRTGR